jgi:hypothetical protein
MHRTAQPAYYHELGSTRNIAACLQHQKVRISLRKSIQQAGLRQLKCYAKCTIAVYCTSALVRICRHKALQNAQDAPVGLYHQHAHKRLGCTNSHMPCEVTHQRLGADLPAQETGTG